jgi:NIMA (never in mitosis gene a)-related kinase
MNGLYKRVLKGMYPKIPGHYSADLSLMIKSLLQVQPNLRPSSDQILKMDVVKKRAYLLSKHN